MMNGSGYNYVAYIFAHDEQTFGEEGDQSIISCGTYTGNGSTTGPTVTLGWDPQLVMIKNQSAAEGWVWFDTMRGLFAGGDDKALFPGQTTIEQNRSSGQVWPLSSGFKLNGSSDGKVNGGGNVYVYFAIRGISGNVGKPPEAGTDVFNVINGTGGDPTFKTGFVTDFITSRPAASSSSWWTYSRPTGEKYLALNSSGTQGGGGASKRLDFMNGFATGASTSDTAWGWKRNAGFDVVNYLGTGDNSNSGPNATSQVIPHSLGKIPEMIWVKCRSTGYNWYVYHKGQNGGTNPWNYSLSLNSTDGEIESVAPYTNAMWNNTAPTSTHFSLGPGNDINKNNDTYLSMLFASVDGISKVGSYSGPGGVVTITTGFQPRFIMVKKANDVGGWHVFDTTRGMGSGNDPLLYLNTTGAQITVDYVTPSSTGWSTTSGNLSEGDYIYYAHA